ncbi:MAG: MauE/DoxX family redox-associated membrane protein [Solirubrobacterales bacterium]
MLGVAARLTLGGILSAASVAKLASPRSSRSALSSFGITEAGAQTVAWAILIAAELILAVGVFAGAEAAELGAAALMALFATTMVGAIFRGRAGAPCACFGVRSTVGWRGVARNLLLAAAFAALPLLPERSLTTDEWLGLGLAVALLACAGLAVAVFALAREIGMLRLRLGPSAALEIPGEGPPLGQRLADGNRFPVGDSTELALGVFLSETCPVCATLGPALRTLEGDPTIALARYDERADTGIWAGLGIPGSPYAVATDRDGFVLAKGTFNNLAQLESVIATAERRRAERAPVETPSRV